MEFEKTIMCHQECFVSGVYKCINYSGWRAYFKPAGWKNWGMACEKKPHEEASKRFRTLKQAQRACGRHLKRFGATPQQFDRL